jgi:hypothetical protein
MATRRFTPTADGSLVFWGLSFFNAQGRSLPSDIKGYDNAIPTSDPRFFIAVKNSGKKSSAVAICTVNDRRILTEIPTVGDVGDNGGYDGGRCGVVGDLPGVGEPRVIYLPDSNTLTSVVVSNDQFNVRKISLQAVAADPKAPASKSLAVISLPPADVAVNGAYSYQIQVLPEKAAVKYKLESGPPGLAVSPTGLVTWKPETRPIGGQVKVILSITDASGNEVPHAFDIAVNRNVATAGAGGADKPSIVKADDKRIELPSGKYRYTTGLGGKGLILSGNQFAVTAADGFTIQESRVLPKAYEAIAERKDYYVALCQEPRSIDILDKKTFAVIRTRAIAFASVRDLVLHPTRAISYVSYHQPGEKPSHHFVIFDETSAEARTDENWIGSWMAIAPDGAFLITGFQETYQKGNQIIDNPDRIWIVPTYGSIDTMARYDLDEDGLPIRVAHKEGVGSNGTGVRLSADGKRATYLSHRGYPALTDNLGGWDPTDLSKLPTAYATKGVASTQDLAFHPGLPLVACPAKDGVAFFHRESGVPEKDRAVLEDLAGETVKRVYFSADGKNLLVEIATGDIHYLLRVPLNLNQQEQEAVKKLPLADKNVGAPGNPNKAAPKQKLPVQKALWAAGPRAEEMV